MRHLLLALVASTVVALLPGPVHAERRAPAPLGSDPYRSGRVYRGDFPDPTVLHARGKWYAYATRTADLNLPVLVSTNLRTWRGVQLRQGAQTADAMPALPAWAWSHLVDGREQGMVWAPSVARIEGRYVAAYSIRVRGPRHKMCISIATAASPRGPFTDRSQQPLVCPHRHGVIDPQLYLRHGRVWLLYKTEDVAVGRPTRLWIQRMGRRGRHLAAAPPVRLLTASLPWEDGVVEAPAMITYRGTHYLFYSGNGWGSHRYAVGYAICRGLTGPCTRPSHHRLLRSDDTITGPGGATPFRGPNGGLLLMYHAWDKGSSHYPHSSACLRTARGCAQRRMHVARLSVDPDGLLSVSDESLSRAH